MHFQHPELLYALFLLIIPLIVHLFRLRKFQKEDFTNVKFLKKVIQETRKSSRLKKFLILITRLLLFTCLILAFAQPFIPSSEKAMEDSKTLIYLDNSFSMQANKGQSSVFQNAINDLIENLDDDRQYALFTNNSDYFNRSTSELKSELQNIEFSDKNMTFRELTLKAQNYFKAFPNIDKDFVIISDFQNLLEVPAEFGTTMANYHFIQPELTEVRNISLDSAYIDTSNPESISLNVLVSSNVEIQEPVTVSVLDGEKLLGRNTVQLDENNSAEINFRLQNEKISNGIIDIEDSGLKYDNELFFNIDENPGIKVAVISDTETDFLDRIYTEPEFETSRFPSQQIDFNFLNSANLIVLNEIEQFPSSLINNLANVQKNGASVIIIPSKEALGGYTQILNSFGFSGFGDRINEERLITSISFDHPLLEGVFENRIDNFEYPKVLTSFNLSSTNSILRYQDNRPFLAESNSVYLFTAALDEDNSNFKNSPLIVPIFYQIGLKSLKKNQLFYLTSRENKIDIPVELGKDQVLHITKPETDIIPQQQNYSNRVELNTGNISFEAGNYEVSNNNNSIGNISFNYDRAESDLTYNDITDLKGIKTYDSVKEYFSESNAASQITTLWKWFVIFAVIFLAIEMLLIKFFK